MRGASAAAVQSKKSPGGSSRAKPMSLKTISKPTRTGQWDAQRQSDGLGHTLPRAQKNGQRRPKKPTKELNKRGDAFIHVGLGRLLSLSAQYESK
jgi:hypothetical protein